MATRNQALTGGVEGETGLAGHGVTLSLPRSDEIASLHAVLNIPLSVIAYGNIYQSGYVFSIDDTTPDTISIGGKAAALVDQTSAIPWSVGYFSIFGIAQTSTSVAPSPSSGALAGMSACNGGVNGACDSINISVAYSGTAPTTYAAGLCDLIIDAYSDWYLPAICEMGYGSAGCPTMANMQSNLVDTGIVTNLSGAYWSSTESSISPQIFTWSEFFATGGGSNQLFANKSSALAVRCVRAIT
ncbi:MAG: hypothetical protein ACLQO1_20485 [Steroidobacteraceae bacterium]